jgi:ABC-type branched-subunit amino acid transport system ATPase component
MSGSERRVCLRDVADRVYFLDRGSVAAEVTARELRDRDDLFDHYLGM